MDAGFDGTGHVNDIVCWIDGGVGQQGQQRCIGDQRAVAVDFEGLVVAAVNGEIVGAANDEGLAVFLVDSSGNIGDDRAAASARES